MKVVFNPTDKETAGGIKSVLRWNSADFLNGMREAFHVSTREKIVRLDITQDGIHAYFEPED